MTKPSKPPTRFSLETCEDMHEKLKWEAQRLENGWSVYDSFNFVVTAHHLYHDWIECCGSAGVKNKKLLLPAHAKMVMQSIVDLSNGNKHWQMTQKGSLERQVITQVHERGINDMFAYLLAGPMVYIEFDDYKLSMAELVHQVLGYFKWMFESGSGDFPLGLLEHLEYCRIVECRK